MHDKAMLHLNCMNAPIHHSTCLCYQSGSQHFSLSVWYPPCLPAPVPAAVVHAVQDVQCLLCSAGVHIVRVVMQEFVLVPFVLSPM